MTTLTFNLVDYPGTIDDFRKSLSDATPLNGSMDRICQAYLQKWRADRWPDHEAVTILDIYTDPSKRNGHRELSKALHTRLFDAMRESIATVSRQGYPSNQQSSDDNWGPGDFFYVLTEEWAEDLMLFPGPLKAETIRELAVEAFKEYSKWKKTNGTIAQDSVAGMNSKCSLSLRLPPRGDRDCPKPDTEGQCMDVSEIPSSSVRSQAGDAIHSVDRQGNSRADEGWIMLSDIPTFPDENKVNS